MTRGNATREPLRFGANYTPSRDWMHLWLHLDLDVVRRDFETLAGMGLDHVRIFPLWPILQPNRTLIRAEAIADVRAVVDVAAEVGLDVTVDVIQGHLSSFDFVPAWLTTWHDTNMFTDEHAVAAQVALVEALGTALADAPNFLGLTLGNETNQFSTPLHAFRWPTTPEQAQNWLETLLAAAERSAPGKHHTHSEYDAVWFMDGHGFTPEMASRVGDSTTIHSWIFNGTAQRFGGRSVASDRHAEYLIELSRAFQSADDRTIWLQEVGAPSNCLTEAEMPSFLEATVRHAATTENLWGVTWWCSHDVGRALADFPDLEYSLGLIDESGSVKPIGERFAAVAVELRAGVEPPSRTVAIEVAVDADGIPVSRGSLSPGGVVFNTWVELCEAGENPTFVTSRTSPEARLSRGIERSVVPDLAQNQVHSYASVNTVVE